MANDLNNNPIYLDTTGATSKITTAVNNVVCIVVNGLTTDNDSVLIQDASLNSTVLELKVKDGDTHDGYTIIPFPGGTNFNKGINLTTLTRGEIMIYIGRK